MEASPRAVELGRWAATAFAAFSVSVGVIVTGTAAPASAHPDDVYEFSGSGWGHSIGLSQYGSYGQALDGKSAEDIIGYYYQGVSIKTLDELVDEGRISSSHPVVTDSDPLWVGVIQNASSITFTPIGGDVRFCQSIDGVGVCTDIGQGDDGAAETWRFAEADEDGVAGCRLTQVTGGGDVAGPLDFGSCRASIIWDDSTLADRVSIDGAVCSGTSGIGRNCLSRGTLRIRDAEVASGFHVALEIGLEQYLYGLGEMPSSWPSAALQAQAIAARAYAVYRLLGNEKPELATANDAGLSDARKAACWCHIYSTVKDQSYVGYAKEAGADSGRWVSAVNATAGRVITHPTATSVQSSVVIAYYHSSSGGVTETNTAVWGTTSQPYLQSVDDAWSNSPAVNNPFETWTLEATAAELAGIMDWDAVSNVQLLNGPPAAKFTFTGTDAGAPVSATVTAATLYSALGTRSPHIDGVTLDAFYPFLDIEGTAHTLSIFRLWEEGVTNGCGGEFYCPEAPLTRAQMATFLVRTLDLDPIAESRFEDVEADSVHAPNINAVAAAGISLGCSSDGTRFCPEDEVSRAQMASFLVRALGLAPVGAGPFTDLGGAAGHQASINALWKAGITNGCSSDGSQYCPLDPVTRAQMATFLVRAFFS